MCTIIALCRVRQDYPLVLATNRDEFYARPTSGPVRLLRSPAAVGGKDLSAGGTWMGVTREGFVAAVTNQRRFAPPLPDARSRGALVMELLSTGTVAAARRLLEQRDAREYNEFNLLFGDAHAAWVGYGRHSSPQIRQKRMPPGLHVLPNGELDSAEFPKCQRVQQLLADHVQAPWPTLHAALEETLADRETAPASVPEGAPPFFTEELMRELTALCVRAPTYGSRSANIVALEPGRCAHFSYADGPPDCTPFEDVTALFR